MIVLRDPHAADAIPYVEIRTLAKRRLAMLSEDEPFDPNVMGYFVVVEQGDAVAKVCEEVGFDLLANRFDGVRFDQPGFTRSFEMLEEHRTCYEIVFVISDDGFGVIVFVPKEEGIDADLLAMCSIHSVPAQQESEP